ncbi:MAG: hypothetical protein KDA93_14280, partial [Planctomycetaceae bacterium]|nr:hypothetical protein [Planctomycetaceae bacterium]
EINARRTNAAIRTLTVGRRAAILTPLRRGNDHRFSAGNVSPPPDDCFGSSHLTLASDDAPLTPIPLDDQRFHNGAGSEFRPANLTVL